MAKELEKTCIYNFAFVERSGTWIVSDRICTSKRRKVKSMEAVYIAGGCLWGVQHFFDTVPGVRSSVAG